VPAIVGVVSVVFEPCAGEAISTTGSSSSISSVKVAVSLPMLPSESTCVTSTVYWSLVSSPAVTDQVPPGPGEVNGPSTSSPLVSGPR
jgi:hypothetical protein